MKLNMFCKSLGISMMCCAMATPAGAAAKAPAQAPAQAQASTQASSQINQQVQLEMKVRSSKLRTERDEVDLNSHTSFRDPENLAVVIPGPVAAWYSYQGIHDLPKYFFGKTIRVSGVVEQFADQRRIFITDPAQIQVLK